MLMGLSFVGRLSPCGKVNLDNAHYLCYIFFVFYNHGDPFTNADSKEVKKTSAFKFAHAVRTAK
jgi:hypothetical protein